MEPESLYNLLQLPKVTGPPAEEDLPQGAVSKWGGGPGQGRGGEGLHGRNPIGGSGHRLAFHVVICSAPMNAFCFVLDSPLPRFQKLPQASPYLS